MVFLLFARFPELQPTRCLAQHMPGPLDTIECSGGGRFDFDQAQCGEERHRGNMLVWPSGIKSTKQGDVHIRFCYYLY